MQGVYFIANLTDNSIKIGFSTNINKRIKSLSTGSSGDLVLLGYIESDKSLEKQLHKQFGQYRIRKNGEWFIGNQILIDYINDNNNIENVYIGFYNAKIQIYKKMKK